MLPRSYLFVPACDEARISAAWDSGADAVILDLEDTVALSRKDEARATAVRWLRRPRRSRVFVRVNALDRPQSLEDFLAVVPAGPDGIALPKAESAADLRLADWLIERLEDRTADTPVELLPIIESARGVLDLDKTLAHAPRRMVRIMFGAGDLALDLGLNGGPDEAELTHARSLLALASRVADLAPPIDKIWLDIDDDAGLRASIRRGLAAGFTAKICLTPAQVPVVHDVLAPTGPEIDAARRIAEAFALSEAAGDASLTVDGRFVDYPIARAARALLDRARVHDELQNQP